MKLDIGYKIKALRTERRMTQNELASMIYVSESTIGAYENGSRIPPHDALIKLSRVFNVSMDYLFGITTSEVISINRLTSQQKRIVRELVEDMAQNNQKVSDKHFSAEERKEQ